MGNLGAVSNEELVTQWGITPTPSWKKDLILSRKLNGTQIFSTWIYSAIRTTIKTPCTMVLNLSAIRTTDFSLRHGGGWRSAQHSSKLYSTCTQLANSSFPFLTLTNVDHVTNALQWWPCLHHVSLIWVNKVEKSSTCTVWSFFFPFLTMSNVDHVTIGHVRIMASRVWHSYKKYSSYFFFSISQNDHLTMFSSFLSQYNLWDGEWQTILYLHSCIAGPS